MKTLFTWILVVEFWFHVLAQLLLFLQRTIVYVDVRELLIKENCCLFCSEGVVFALLQRSCCL